MSYNCLMPAQAKPNALEHRSFRLPRKLLGEIRRRADLSGVSQTALVERYLEEGVRMDEHPMIVFRNSPLGRRAMLAGTRLDVSHVADTVRAEGGSVEKGAAYLGLGSHHVRACIQYYAEYQVEVDAYARRVATENDRLREAHEREQALLAG